MAESAAQRNERLRAERKAALARSDGGAREDAATKAVVSPPVPTTKGGPSNDNDMRTRHYTAKNPSASVVSNRPKPTLKPVVNRQAQQGARGSNKVYQRHVLFALVTAFLIQVVAAGKSLPTAKG